MIPPVAPVALICLTTNWGIAPKFQGTTSLVLTKTAREDPKPMPMYGPMWLKVHVNFLFIDLRYDMTGSHS